MHGQIQNTSAKQLPLDLDVDPAAQAALRTAYLRLQLSLHLSFEQVMSDPCYAIGIRNLAHAMSRRRSAASAR